MFSLQRVAKAIYIDIASTVWAGGGSVAAAAVRVLARLRERGQVRHVLLREHAAPAAIREEGHEHPAMPDSRISRRTGGREDGGSLRRNREEAPVLRNRDGCPDSVC